MKQMVHTCASAAVVIYLRFNSLELLQQHNFPGRIPTFGQLVCISQLCKVLILRRPGSSILLLSQDLFQLSWNSFLSNVKNGSMFLQSVLKSFPYAILVSPLQFFFPCQLRTVSSHICCCMSSTQTISLVHC